MSQLAAKLGDSFQSFGLKVFKIGEAGDEGHNTFSFSISRRAKFANMAGDKFVPFADLLAGIYFGLVASDQYVSEAKFTVSSGAIPKMDNLGSVTGLPPILIVQDTQVVTSYIQSRAMVEQLEHTVGLRDAYGSKSIDWWARFRKDEPIEKFTDYWEKMWQSSPARKKMKLSKVGSAL